MATLRLLFSRETADDSDTIDPANYVIASGVYTITVDSVVRRSGKVIDLIHTAEQGTGLAYTVTASINDANGKPIDPDKDSVACFTGVGGTAPQVSSVAQVDPTHLDVVFDEAVNETTAEATGNYSVTGGGAPAVSAAALDADTVTVHLTLGAALTPGEITVAVVNVTDVAGNVVDAAHDDYTLYAFVFNDVTPGGSPDARWTHGFACDENNDLGIMYGGSDGSAPWFSDTWSWNGTTKAWTNKAPAHNPGERCAHVMCFAPNNKILSFGGLVGVTRQNDTWLWDTSDWTQASPATVPGIRDWFHMAYDSVRNVVVMFGGRMAAAPGRLDDTWEWDGSDWTQYAAGAVTKPSARHSGAFAFDPIRQECVLFGGNDGGLDAETWTWNGSVWTLKTPAHSPAGRYYPACAWNPIDQSMVIFGGEGAGGNLNDVWKWDGTDWTEITAITGTRPSARANAKLIWDTRAECLTMFGGDASGVVNHTYLL